MKDDDKDFRVFMKKREQASVAFVKGDFQPLDLVSTHTSPASIFGPRGDCIFGADEVNAANAAGAAMFQAKGTSSFEIAQLECNDDMAYWVGIQRSTVQMQGMPEPARMDLRVTETFRREDGGWKLVHRHADPLKIEPKSGKSSNGE